MVVSLYYQWPIYVSMLGNNLSNLNGGKRLLVATSVFRNEPYGPTGTCMKTSILRTNLRAFARDQRGVSAVEFALLAPMMIGLYLGCVEISDGVGADRKVSLTAAALANLSAQVSTISTSDMTNILDASSRDHRALFGQQAEDDGVRA